MKTDMELRCLAAMQVERGRYRPFTDTDDDLDLRLLRAIFSELLTPTPEMVDAVASGFDSLRPGSRKCWGLMMAAAIGTEIPMKPGDGIHGTDGFATP